MKFTIVISTVLLLLLAAAAAQAVEKKLSITFQAAEMVALPSGQPEGAATLIRHKNRLEGRVMVNVETSGDPYTVWWVVFNNPKKCTYTPCTVGEYPLDDLLNPAVGVSIYSAAGAISASNGNSEEGASHGVINLDVKTRSGQPPKGLFTLSWVDGTPFGDRLRRGNGFGAEVHLIVDRHPNLASWVEELTTTNWGPNSNHRAAVFLAP